MRISDWSSDVCSSDLQFFQGRTNHADMEIRGPVPFYQLPPSGPAEGVSHPPPRARKRRTRSAAIVALETARAASALARLRSASSSSRLEDRKSTRLNSSH